MMLCNRDVFFLSLTEEEKNDPRFAISSEFSDSDRQLLFAEFVKELQTAEGIKRRRSDDAFQRAEKAQREAYRALLRRLATEGKIRPYTRWRNVEELVVANDAFNPVLSQGREAPREIYEDFVDEWRDAYQQERLVLAQLKGTSSAIQSDTSFQVFVGQLLKEAEGMAGAYSDVRHMIEKGKPVTSVRLYWEELLSKQRYTSRIKDSVKEESSEDEGEIVEEDKKPSGNPKR